LFPVYKKGWSSQLSYPEYSTLLQPLETADTNNTSICYKSFSSIKCC